MGVKYVDKYISHNNGGVNVYTIIPLPDFGILCVKMPLREATDRSAITSSSLRMT